MINFTGPRTTVDNLVVTQSLTLPSGALPGELASNVFPVFPGGPYTTITAAINAAVTAGHTNQLNPAVVLVSPVVGGYDENVILSAGVDVIGVWSENRYSVLVNGKVSYTPGTQGTLEKVNVQGLYIIAPTGLPCIELVGSNQGQLFVRGCVCDKQESSAPNVSVNGYSKSELFIQDCIGAAASGGTVWSVQSGLVDAFNCDLSGSSSTRSVLVGASGSFEGFAVNLVSSGADVVNVASGGLCELVASFVTQDLANASGFVMSGGTCVLLYTYVSVPSGAGYAAKGTGIVEYAHLAFASNTKFQSSLTSVPLTLLPTSAA